MKVLLVEDDCTHAEATVEAIGRLGAELMRVKSGEEAIGFLRKNSTDLVILEWQLPGLSGLEVLHWIRAHLGSRLPVLFLSGNALEADVVKAFDSGADAYVMKPSRALELAARIKVLLPRKNIATNPHEMLVLGDYRLNFIHQVIYCGSRPVHLSRKECAVVALLFRNVNRAISRETLVKLAWGPTHDKSTRSVDTHIARIRKKLSFSTQNGISLVAVYKHGYKLISSNEESE
jgi:DNA-binding response OmpR family regulator